MARNAEKAMTTLARWRAAQVQEAGGQRERRPYLASDCNDLPQAEKWRLQIVREIAKKVAQIQNVKRRYGELFVLINNAVLTKAEAIITTIYDTTYLYQLMKLNLAHHLFQWILITLKKIN